MKNLPNIFAGGTLAASKPHRVSQLREDWRVARAAHTELALLGMPRVNLLLTGAEGVIENLLDALLPNFREPIGQWSPGDRLLLPPAKLIRTMILREVGAMPDEDQRRLLEWLNEAAGRTQVVSTTSAPLLPRVEAGAFIDALYYRLNIVCVDATS
jgi:hypothetical protein